MATCFGGMVTRNAASFANRLLGSLVGEVAQAVEDVAFQDLVAYGFLFRKALLSGFLRGRVAASSD